MTAENGGTLYFYHTNILYNYGTMNCDADSTFYFSKSGTLYLYGTVNCDGLFRVYDDMHAYFSETAGTGTGTLRLDSSTSRATFNGNTTIEFGTVNVGPGYITAQNGAIITIHDLYTHAVSGQPGVP